MPGTRTVRPARPRQGVGRGPAKAGTARRGTGRPGNSGLGNAKTRIKVGRILLIGALLAAVVKLAIVQGFESGALAAKAQSQRSTPQVVQAHRGSITDRDGRLLAFSVETRVLSANPRRIAEDWDKLNDKFKKGRTADDRKQQIAAKFHEILGDAAPEQTVLELLRRDATYVVLADNVEPGQARQIADACPEIRADLKAQRKYPNNNVASNIIGEARWGGEDPKRQNLHGLTGLEISQDNVLAGTDGLRMFDSKQGNNDLVLPGTEKDLDSAVPGTGIELTIDTDLQHKVQEFVAAWREHTSAKGASATVIDVKTGEVYALANDKSYDLNGTIPKDQVGDPAVTNPFEPGSVNKVVTASAAIEYGVATPDTVLTVPDEIKVADRTIHDSHTHPPQDMTFTGVLARSSNVGTVLTAQQVGKERFADMLSRFGLGKRTEVGLAGESPGIVPPVNQWSGSTFGNLPIGQGLSMTLLQMTGMYQAIANDGLRIPPRIIKAKVGPGDTRTEEPRPEPVRVVSPETAKTVRTMLEAVFQDSSDQLQRGTGRKGQVAGFQLSGKTGTAQQPISGRGYSNDDYWITFAGMLPADNPRFVIGIMVDRPDYHMAGGDGQTAATLFADIATYTAQRYGIPTSSDKAPEAKLILR